MNLRYKATQLRPRDFSSAPMRAFHMTWLPAGFLFKSSSITRPQAILILGGIVAVSSVLALMVRFSQADETVARKELHARLTGSLVPAPAGD